MDQRLDEHLEGLKKRYEMGESLESIFENDNKDVLLVGEDFIRAEKEGLLYNELLKKDQEKRTKVIEEEQRKKAEEVKETFPVTEDEVHAPEKGEVPSEPALVQVEDKFAAISGTADKDYDNVLETYRIYREGYENKSTDYSKEIKQLKLLERNAASYTRWKFSIFMKSTSVKYKRFQQMKEMEKFAIKKRKELEAKWESSKSRKIQYEVWKSEDGLELDELHKNRKLPMRIITILSGTIHFYGAKFIRFLSAKQKGPDSAEDTLVGNKNYAEIHAQAIQDVFKKKPGLEEQIRRQAAEDAINQELDPQQLEEEDITDIETVAVEVRKFAANRAYHSLIDIQKELLAEYKKPKNKRSKSTIKNLESEIKSNQKLVNDFNNSLHSEQDQKFWQDTTESDNLNEELDKYRS